MTILSYFSGFPKESLYASRLWASWTSKDVWRPLKMAPYASINKPLPLLIAKKLPGTRKDVAWEDIPLRSP